MKRFLPLLLLFTFMLLAYGFGLHELLSIETLRLHRSHLKTFVAIHPFIAPFLYILVYSLMTALSIPGALFLSLFGGFLFPQPFATLYIVLGATSGACVIFEVAKTALGEELRKRAGPFLKNMEEGFRGNAANYLLFLRLVPLFPFWLVNLAPAFFGVRLWTFAWTTFVGIFPGAFVFAQAGVGLGEILEGEGGISVDQILNPQVRLALIALALFALLPVVVKKIRG